ncbi:PLDc N-terminal domain-containing protein [Curtobacterium oceanosedimentum]|uniref:PLDc N-terminal domain-containing protein n=1 Tax=Curtobacterium oceanosedimentum TaxID=465820 RepID=UPI000A8D32AD|nr:PLD nuclease N-terminal domain-containing protein [Curtobacterium oceanosedimentum]
MNGLPIDPALLAPLAPVAALVVALVGWSLVSLVRKPAQYLPKIVWAVVIVLAVPAGAVLYLVLGRGRGPALVDGDAR